MHNTNYTINSLMMNQLHNHLNQLTNKYSKLLPLRMDFYYHSQTDTKQAYCDMTNLSDSLKGKFDIVGYAWVMELNQQENIHFHAIFYIDGHKRQRYYPVYKQIDTTWKTVTKQNGFTNDCNRNSDDYKVKALTMINYHDYDAKNALIYALSYLAKDEQKYALYHHSMPLFFISEVQQPSGRGRPRQYHPM